MNIPSMIITNEEITLSLGWSVCHRDNNNNNNNNNIEKFVMCTTSVSCQNQRRGQSLVAHGRVKKQQQNNMFLTYV